MSVLQSITDNNGYYPPFSVLISVYKKERAEYFDRSLESVLIRQTITPNEVVLICDGPLTDELDAVIEKYQGRFPDIIRLFRLEKQGGLGMALKFGVKKCSFDLVARADSDDICCQNRFELQLNYMCMHPEISVLGGYIDEFSSDWEHPKCIREVPADHASIVKMMKYRNALNHVSVMFHKNDILDIGSYRHIPFVEDYDLWIRLILGGKKLANLEQCLVHVRVGNGMIARRGNKAYLKGWKILNAEMKNGKLINSFEYLRNLVAIHVFIYMPSVGRASLYRLLLRKNIS